MMIICTLIFLNILDFFDLSPHKLKSEISVC